MDRSEALALFESLTGAAPHVAEHVLDAHGWDVNSAVSWFLESGGVGHGTGAAAAGPPASPPDYIEEPDDDDEPEILDDDEDDVQVLASSLGRRRPGRVEEVADEDQPLRVGSVEEDLEAAMGRRVRRNRRRLAGEVDRDLELLGQRFGVMDEFQPAPRAGQQRAQQAQQAQQGGDGGDLPDLPDDVDLEEQRMLMAAIQGGGYEGNLPDFAADPRYQPRVLSPGARARQDLREEQDAAYYESLRADQEKAEAAERERREAEAAAAAAAAAAEAEARAQREAAEALERQLSSKSSGLPAEPAADEPGTVNVLVRLPGGGRMSRRFRQSDPLQAVFDFVDVQSGMGGETTPGSYHLATSYPRRVLEDGANAQTLADAGLTAKQEALFLELK